MTPQPIAAVPADVARVYAFPLRWRSLILAGRLAPCGIFLDMLLSPRHAHDAPVWKVLAVAALLASLAGGLVEFRSRVLLEPSGLLVIRGFGRTRIAWEDVQQLRPRVASLGPGWVDLVQEPPAREMRLPVPVAQFLELRQTWAAAKWSASPEQKR